MNAPVAPGEQVKKRAKKARRPVVKQHARIIVYPQVVPQTE